MDPPKTRRRSMRHGGVQVDGREALGTLRCARGLSPSAITSAAITGQDRDSTTVTCTASQGFWAVQPGFPHRGMRGAVNAPEVKRDSSSRATTGRRQLVI